MKGHAFLTRICSVQINQCQIHFRAGILKFDLVQSCSDCGWVPLTQLKAIWLHIRDTKPTPVASGDEPVLQVDFWSYNAYAFHIYHI